MAPKKAKTTKETVVAKPADGRKRKADDEQAGPSASAAAVQPTTTSPKDYAKEVILAFCKDYKAREAEND